MDEATSALDAESETLVNSALAALLRGNNTTISIAHRLSTIKRSDTIIVLGKDGRVAEQGSYEVLSARKEGAFTKLMEWQMSGGDVVSAPRGKEEEEVRREFEVEEGEGEEGEEGVEEGTKVRGKNVTAGEVVLEKTDEKKG